ncbi:6-bladed beta-propeller [Parabacteroides pacaensis]|uniref:6-bladed beta-propeller n=1 Tax=Parabacteroides pacaensis TaxID=2086575 RepID=UPI000D0EEA53|nr:6-bladed beta-propeller [Parabacteroides pacaensis]
MNKIILLSILSASMLLTGYAEKSPTQKVAGLTFIPKDKITTIKEIAYNDSRFIDSCVFIPLETSDSVLISEIVQIESYNDRYYIYDRHRETTKLRVFDSKGKFLFDIGKQGNGAKEYRAMNAFFLNGKENKVGIFDPMRLAVHEYDLNGKFLQTIRHGQESFVSISKTICVNDYIYCFFHVSSWNDIIYFKLSPKDYSIIDKWMPYPVKIEGQQMGATLLKHPFSIIGNELHHVSLYSDTLYSYQDGKDRPYLLIETGKPNIPSDYFKGKPFEHKPNDAFIEIWRDERYSPGFTELFETDRYIMVVFRLNNDFYIIDKDKKKTFHILTAEEFYLDFMKSSLICGNKLIKVLDQEQISYYQNNIKNGNKDYPKQIRELMSNYNVEEDNPILIIYYMKQSTK